MKAINKFEQRLIEKLKMPANHNGTIRYSHYGTQWYQRLNRMINKQLKSSGYSESTINFFNQKQQGNESNRRKINRK